MDYHFLPIGSCKFDGVIQHGLSFILNKQLLNKSLWKSFVNVFKTKEDSEDLRWRCEYWGKMMRGACLCYQYCGDKELYKTLEDTVKDLLSTQDEFGRISTYTIEREFQSWDMWGRKYVLTALEHFYEICKDESLKQKILKAMQDHVNYIIDKVGNKEGQIDITETSNFWLGVNSASILESIVALYRLTKNKKYLDFSRYIVNSGGIKGGNLIDEVSKQKLLPHELSEAKAYETMSFFEGVMEYAIEVNDQALLNTSIEFFESVNNSEISIIGNAGSEDENFSNAIKNQTHKPERFGQETCVAVTWMRILHKLYLFTNNYKYHERFITTALNAYYGSINFNNQSSTDYPNKKLPPLPFDSYSPLVYGKRGIATGGLNFMKDGTMYGCCACIGSAGIGLLGLDCVLENEKTIEINSYFSGKVITNSARINIEGDYLKNGKVHLNIESSKEVILKIPSWSNPTILMNQKRIEVSEDSINIGKGKFEIDIDFRPEIKRVDIEDKTAFKYGPLVLGLDEKDNPDINLSNINSSLISDIDLIDNSDANMVAFKAKYKDNKLIFKDYASCGKYWDLDKCYMTAFMER